MADENNYWNFAQIGLELAGAVMLGAACGWWADKKLGTGPWLTLVGALLGIAGGFYVVARELFKPGEPPAGGKK